MKNVLLIIAILIATGAHGQDEINYSYVRNYGFKVLKKPNKGHLDLDISNEYLNVITIHTNRLEASCENDYELKMTTATGRVRVNKSCNEYSMGTMTAKDFPAVVDVKFKDRQGDWITYSVKVIYPGYRFTIKLFKD